MSGKSLINSVSEAVNESLSGCVLTYPHLELHSTKRVVLKPAWNQSNNKVSIVSGGGSGHEPFTAGFVGDGMLTASVSGSIFASPPSSHIFYAIQCVSKNNNNAGCLVITPNYTGDVLNFGLAIERANHYGLKVAQVVVGEDCSIPENEMGRAGKRALPGIVLAIKIAGAMAQRGKSLEIIKNFSQLITDNMASCSMGITACTIPNQGRMFELADDEFEFGQGLHGEAGYKKMKSMTTRDTVTYMIRKIENTLKFAKDDSMVVSVNNFGGLSQLEQNIFVKESVTQLREMGFSILRVYSDLLMTSLDASGVHLTILKLPKNKKFEIIEYLDDQTNAPKWPGCSYSVVPSYDKTPEQNEVLNRILSGPIMNEEEQKILKKCLKKACEVIIEKEQMINDLDRGCGDGDCGTTLKNLAEGILLMIEKFPLSHPASLLFELASIAEDRMGGTSGALYSLMFTTGATKMSNMNNVKNWIDVWIQTWRAGVDGILKYSKAKLGDKTMIDVLEPALEEFENCSKLSFEEIITRVTKKATTCSEATKNMVPKAGRASYVKQDKYLKGMDAGAYAVATWVNAIANALQK